MRGDADWQTKPRPIQDAEEKHDRRFLGGRYTGIARSLGRSQAWPTAWLASSPTRGAGIWASTRRENPRAGLVLSKTAAGYADTESVVDDPDARERRQR